MTRIEAHDFAQHADLDLDLSRISEAAIIGENGAGKSKLMEAAIWCLYGRPIRGNVDAKIRDGRLGMWVRTTWDRDGQSVVVMRSRSTETKAGESGLAVQIDGQRETRHTISETQELLDSLIGLTRDQLLAGPWMAQGRSAELMELRPAGRKALLHSLFGLDAMEAYHERAKARLAGAVAAHGALAERYRLAQVEVDGQLDAERRLSVLEDESARANEVVARATADLERLRSEAIRLREEAAEAAQLDRAMTERRAELDRVTAEGGRLNGRMADIVAIQAMPLAEPAYQDVSPIGTPEFEGLEEGARLLQAARRQLQTANDRIERAEAGAKVAAEKGLCDTCPYREDVLLTDEAGRATMARDVIDQLSGVEQRLADERVAYATAVERRRLALDGNETRRVAFEQAVDRRRQLAEEAVIARGMIASRKELADQLGSAITTATREYLRLIQSQDRAKEVMAEGVQAKEALAAADARARTVHGDLAVAEDAVRRIRRTALALPGLMDSVRQSEESQRILAVVAKMFHRDGLPTLILEAGIPAIEDRANEVLAKMPGGISLTFVTQKRTKQDTWSDDLDVVITEGGKERPYEEMSGAERFRIDLAQRIAIQTVLQHRSGRRWETLWLDEPFSAQRRGETLELVLQAIASVAREFGLTLVVTHEPEVADRFSAQIEVVESDGIARARVA